MTKRHYFVIFAEDKGGEKFEWFIDNTAFSATNKPVYNKKTGEWESIYINENKDDLISIDLTEKLKAECIAGDIEKR